MTDPLFSYVSDWLEYVMSYRPSLGYARSAIDRVESVRSVSDLERDAGSYAVRAVEAAMHDIAPSAQQALRAWYFCGPWDGTNASLLDCRDVALEELRARLRDRGLAV